MGEVWRATHDRLGRAAALKLIRPEMLGARDAPGRALLRKRFEREARATASLTSPHTVELYDFGVADDGTLWYAMALLRGWDLDGLVRTHGVLPPARVVHLLMQACDALAEAHAQGIVHRDIKPANLHVGHKGVVSDFLQVLDFGLVKLGDLDEQGSAASTLTVDGVITGSPAFLPPELAGAGSVGPHTDVYALGCVGYWLATGSLVFPADNGLKMVLAHLNQSPRPPSDHVATIPSDLERVILSCLEKAPSDRPESAEELRSALSQCGVSRSWQERDAKDWWTAHPLHEDPRLIESYEATVAEADLEVEAESKAAATQSSKSPPTPVPPVAQPRSSTPLAPPQSAALHPATNASEPAVGGRRPVPAMFSIERADVVGQLRDNYALSVLDLPEFERRVELAEAATKEAELIALIDDLPGKSDESELSRKKAPAPSTALAQRPETLVAVLSGVKRAGAWQLASSTRVVAVLGGAVLDLCDVRLPVGETVVTCACVMGGAEIIVPEDMDVVVEGLGILGAFADNRLSKAPASPNASVLRVRGFALFGGVEVRTETKKERRARLKRLAST